MVKLDIKLIDRGDLLSKKCWEIRGCPQDLMENCMFGIKQVPCEITCHFAASACKGYDMVATTDYLDDTLDSTGLNIVKEQCYFCKVLREYLRKQKSKSE